MKRILPMLKKRGENNVKRLGLFTLGMTLRDQNRIFMAIIMLKYFRVAIAQLLED